MSERNINKMKKQRKHSQLKEQENFERSNNETDFSSLLDLEFKREVIKILKVLRKTIDRNAHHCIKELETIKRNQSKLEN